MLCQYGNQFVPKNLLLFPHPLISKFTLFLKRSVNNGNRRSLERTVCFGPRKFSNITLEINNAVYRARCISEIGPNKMSNFKARPRFFTFFKRMIFASKLPL